MVFSTVSLYSSKHKSVPSINGCFQF